MLDDDGEDTCWLLELPSPPWERASHCLSKSQLRAHRMGVPEKHVGIYHPSPVGMSVGARAPTHTVYTQKYTTSFSDQSFLI